MGGEEGAPSSSWLLAPLAPPQEPLPSPKTWLFLAPGTPWLLPKSPHQTFSERAPEEL